MWSGKRGQGVEMAVAIAIMLAGLIVFLRPLLADGLVRAPGDLGDSRLFHHLLEHSWQWVTGNPHHPL